MLNEDIQSDEQWRRYKQSKKYNLVWFFTLNWLKTIIVPDQCFTYSQKSTGFALAKFRDSLNFPNELLLFETVALPVLTAGRTRCAGPFPPPPAAGARPWWPRARTSQCRCRSAPRQPEKRPFTCFWMTRKVSDSLVHICFILYRNLLSAHE